MKVSKWEMLEELLLLERVEKEGTSVAIPYVCLLDYRPYPSISFFCAFPGSPANRWLLQRAQVQLVNLKTLYK